MTLPLNTDVLRTSYDYLNSTQPFAGWNLPEGEDVKFDVTREPARIGRYDFVRGKHIIGISSRCVGHTDSLMRAMAHEMIHLHEQHCCACGTGGHSRAFVRWAVEVCRIHGFDPLAF